MRQVYTSCVFLLCIVYFYHVLFICIMYCVHLVVVPALVNHFVTHVCEKRYINKLYLLTYLLTTEKGAL